MAETKYERRGRKREAHARYHQLLGCLSTASKHSDSLSAVQNETRTKVRHLSRISKLLTPRLSSRTHKNICTCHDFEASVFFTTGIVVSGLKILCTTAAPPRSELIPAVKTMQYRVNLFRIIWEVFFSAPCTDFQMLLDGETIFTRYCSLKSEF